MKRTLIFVLLACSTSAVSAPPRKPLKAVQNAPRQARSVVYDFKGVPLETSFDEFHGRAHPDGRADTKVVCTGEKDPVLGEMREPPGVRVYDPAEEAAGVKKCVWVYTKADKSIYTSVGEQVPLDLAGSGYSAYDYAFSFVPDPKDGLLRLYEIRGVSNTAAASSVIEALTAKWGSPKIVNDTVQNELGGTFPQVTALWVNPAGNITVKERWTKIDNMAVFLRSSRLGAIVKAVRDKQKASIPNPI